MLRNYLQKVLISGLFFGYFPLFSPPMSIALEKKVESQYVIIRSSFQEENERPPITDHQYDLKSTQVSSSEYQPVLDFSGVTLPQDFPDSELLHWLTTTSAGIAEFFLGARGVYENGVSLYRRGLFKQAVDKFELVRNGVSPYQDRSSLWLSWTYFKLKLYDKSQRVLADLLNMGDATIKQEALYLSSLIYRKLDSGTSYFKTLEPVFDSIPKNLWDGRLNYLYLVNLVFQKRWNEAYEFVTRIDKSNLYYSKLFYKIIELEGFIFFNRKDYKSSIERYLLVKQLDSDPSNQPIYEKALAWSRYYTGQHQLALSGLAGQDREFWREYSDEMEYLKLLCFLRLKDWERVEGQYKAISKQSEFYQRTSFLLRSRTDHDDGGSSNLKRLLAGIAYEQPERKFYSAFLDGNQKFRENKFGEAENLYIKALSTDVVHQAYKVAEYNLALTYLKENRFKESLKLFKTLEKDLLYWIPYHQLYIKYQLKKDEEFINQLQKLDLTSWKTDHRLDVLSMKAGIHLSRGENSRAASEYIALWNETRRVEALEYAAKAFYRERSYNKVVGLTINSQNLASEIIFSYRIRSLLGLRKFERAAEELRARDIQGGRLIQLRMEVWLANKQYKKITTAIPALLRQSLSREERLFYYLSLGDAYFNLQQYPKSKNQFYKALAIAETSKKRSVIYYNLILSTFFSADKASFLREITLTLQKKELSGNIRYNLTLLLADFYFTEGDKLKADDLLAEYVQKYPHKRNQAYRKRISLLYSDQQLKQCFYLSQTPPGVEDNFQTRDRLIIGAKCSRTKSEERYIIRSLSRELERKDDYRVNELGFILSKAYFSLRQYGKSIAKLEKLDLKDAHETIKVQAKLLLAENYLRLKKAEKAQSVLGDVNLLRHSSYYPDALLLSSNIKQAQSKTGEALRSMLRIYYLKTTPLKKKQDLLLKMANLLVKKREKTKALKYYKLIKLDVIKQDKNLFKRYRLLKIEIMKLS